VRLLIAGGTSFVGRAVALGATSEGHEVTVLNRGVTPSDLPSSVEHLVGDRHGDLSALSGRSFDATVDTIAYRPSDVASLHAALGDRGGHHVQISSVSAYADPPEEGATEASAALWPAGSADPDAPITLATYGPLKAECERAAASLFGAAIAVVRPTYVIGGHDATLRFPYWVQRARRGGAIAVPGPRGNAMQYIDARDLGAFVVGLAADGTSGAFTAAGPWPTGRFVDVVEQVVRHVAPTDTEVVEVPAGVVDGTDLGNRFPLWSGAHSETVLAMDPTKAIAAGLSCRPLTESIDDVLAWWGDRPWPEHWLDADTEAGLLRQASGEGAPD
jgi:nucleoside-diphosphate-sugar epimerase